MKNERRNKRLYKTISCIIVFFVCVFAFVSLAVCKASNNKVNAGVIIEETYIKDTTNVVVGSTWATIPLAQVQYMGIKNTSLGENEIAYILDGSTTAYTLTLRKYDGETAGVARYSIAFSRPAQYPNITQTYFMFDLVEINGIQYIMFDFTSPVNLNNLINIQGAIMRVFASQVDFFTKSATIAPSQNIFDVERNTLTLLYLSDISGLNTNAMQDEITINWGYIDQSDNTLYAEYAPTISAQNLLSDDKKIRLGLPVNAQGDAMQYYDISQQAILSISGISTGSATATANIYGVYVWRNENNIKWGLANFNTATTPQSAMSMNYLTSFTELFDYQNMNTATMTCRLNVSNNFNFITIKNQTSVNVDNVNNVIQQGGFLPAWAVYNWARGTYSGYIAGEASASAEYQEGMPKYDAIYQAGYKAGFDSAEIGTGAWFITAFNAVDRFLNIHIFPNITFGVLLGIPFVISLTWFIIRMFRGGGGD